MIPKKPDTGKTEDEFIHGAKLKDISSGEMPAQQTAASPINALEAMPKTFMLRLPLSLWASAKDKAADERKSLHAFILEAVYEKIERARRERANDTAVRY